MEEPDWADNDAFGDQVLSSEFQQYQESELEEPDSFYERAAIRLGEIWKFPLGDIPLLNTKIEDIERDMRISRMECDTDEIGALLILPLLAASVLLLPLTLLLGWPNGMLLWGLPLFWIYWVISYPGFQATVTKIKSADESLRIILYMAMHLDMTPSLEGAVTTASSHTDGPISDDLKKIMWDTETRQYMNVKEGIADYMQLWREWSRDFVKSFEYLLDSLTRSGDGRERMIKKGQENIIQSTKDKMDDYARQLSSPVRVIQLAGIVLPLMGLIMFPLISVFLNQGNTSIGGITGYMAFGYLFVLPLFLYFLVKRLISKRPGAYSHPSLNNVEGLPPKNKLQVTIRGTEYLIPLIPLGLLAAFVVMIPGLLYFADLFSIMISYETSVNVGAGSVASEQWSEFIEQQYEVENLITNVIQAMTIIWGAALGIIIIFYGRSYKRMAIRQKIEEIEDGIEVGMTAMENALSKGMPIERAVYEVVDEFEKIGEEGHPLREFFSHVLNRIQGSGTPFKRAIFDPNEGAIQYYPSNMLRNVMKTVSNSQKQGTRRMAKNIRTVNEYIKNQKRVETLIEQLLSDTVGQMKMQARFIAPIITGAAASMSILIVEMLFAISQQLQAIESQIGLGSNAAGGLTDQIGLISQLDSALPPTVMLLIVGIYLIEVSLILAYFTNGIENGFDEINRDIEIGRTMVYGVVIFTVIVFVASMYITPFVGNIA